MCDGEEKNIIEHYDYRGECSPIQQEEKPYPNAIDITEEMEIHKTWYLDAEKQTLETLPEFVKHLIQDYNHDYGTICHAITAAAIAAAWTVDHDPKQGGVTGFQAGCIMWEFIQNWMSEYKDKPLRLTNYENMLFPQYKYTFTTISEGTWKWLQKEAEKRLHERSEHTHPDVIAHWISIAEGNIPFGYTIKFEGE